MHRALQRQRKGSDNDLLIISRSYLELDCYRVPFQCRSSSDNDRLNDFDPEMRQRKVRDNDLSIDEQKVVTAYPSFSKLESIVLTIVLPGTPTLKEIQEETR